MKQKRTYIILGAIGLVFAVFWVVVLALVAKTLLGLQTGNGETPVLEATLCAEDASGLCVTHFGANSLNRMVIHFQLPAEGYDPFYVKARNRDTVSVYTCEVDEADLTTVRCTGLRTPLGETIDLEVYSTDGDTLIARGTFLVSAIAISTPISQPEPFIEEVPSAPPVDLPDAPTFDVPTFDPAATEEPFIEEFPTPLPEDFSPPEPSETPSP